MTTQKSGIPRAASRNPAGMNREPTPAYWRAYWAAKSPQNIPLSPAELANELCDRAAEMARAEQRRNRQPQLELGHV